MKGRLVAVDQNRSVPIAIIGIGCLLPKADGVESFWSNIQDGVDAITDVPPSHWRPEDYFDKDPKKPDHTYAARGGFLSPVDFPALELGISPNTLEAIDTTQLLGLLVAKRTLESAGYGAGREFDRNRVSVILGVTGTLELVVPLGARLGHPQWKRALKDAGVDEAVAEQVVQRIADSYVGWQEDSFPGLLGNVVAGRIANRLDLGGTNCVVDAACASSLSALHLALLELSAGRSDMVLTGGMDTFNDIFMYMCFSKTPALSPTGQAKPFDAKADGTILGEGLGCVLLKRLDDAERDGDKILAVIRSVGTSSDGKGQAIYAPSPTGQTKALRQAYELAGIDPETIELVEAHGTGTRAGDAAEVAALNEVYQSGRESVAPWCALGSVKSQIGHTKAAAGAAGLIKAALALHHKVLPPTLHVTQPIEPVAPGQSPFYVNTEKRPWMPPHSGHPRRAAVSAFGFGGSNFHCVLEEYGSAKESIAGDSRVQIVAFSADTPESLCERLRHFPEPLGWDDLRIEAARSRNAFDASHVCRLTIVVERDKKPLGESIASALATLAASPAQTEWTTPDGVFFSRQPAAGTLAMIFPGQGSQYAGMMRDLTCRYPAMHAALADADAIFAKDRTPPDARRLSDFIYPIPAFVDRDRTRNEDALRATAVAQPALGALSIGAVRLLESFGVKPAAAAGHSFGELTALCAAGWIDAPTLHALAKLRGHLMSEGSNDRGGMLAVRAPLDVVETILRDDRLDLTLANRNAPNQSVLSGSSAEIAKAREAFARRQIDSLKLPVAAAFHSTFVADACGPFRRSLESVAIHPTDIPVFSNTTAQEYPRDAHAVRRLLAGQLAEPVDFVAEIKNLYAAGVRTFLEVGPGNKLSGLIGAILDNRPHAALALDASAGKRSGVVDLARILAQLAAIGHPVHLAAWDEGQSDKQTKAERKPTLTVPLCGANYVKPKAEKPPMPKPAAAPSKNGDAPRPAVQRRVAENGNGMTPIVDPRLAAPVPSPSFPPTNESLLALQKLGEQTAQLHRQFLEGQDRALQVMQALINNVGQAFQPDGPGQTSLVPVGQRQAGKPDLHPAAVTHPPERNGHPPVVAAPTSHRFESTLLNVVAGVTGYPAEMLQLDMELDTDLGIDSIKRVEIFALLQEKLPGTPPIRSEQMGTIRTLRQVIGLLGAESNGRADVAPADRAVVERIGNPAKDAALTNGRLEKALLDVVAGVTGYPAEMLQLDMELDTDLGIDSIKRVEIFALLQERVPEAPPIKSEQMGTIRTLRQVIGLLDIAGQNGRAETVKPNGKPVLPPTRNGHVEPAKPPANGQLERALLDVVAGVTGYPAEMLQLDMELDTDLGIDSIKRVEIFAALQEKLPHAPTIKSDQMGNLRTLRQVAAFLGDSPEPSSNGKNNGSSNGHAPAVRNGRNDSAVKKPNEHPLQRLVLSAAALVESAARQSLALARDGEIWITADDVGLAPRLARRLNLLGYKTRLIHAADLRALATPSCLVGLIILASMSTFGEAYLLEAFQLLQKSSAGLRSGGAAGGSTVMTVARMDGKFGLSNSAANYDPIQGGLAGLAKTAHHEWPEVRCKAVDLDVKFTDLDEAAVALANEMFLDGPLEVGISPDSRCSLELIPTSFAHAEPDPPLQTGDVVLITGGARGVTAETAVALAEAFAPTIVLLGRSAPTAHEPEWLAMLSGESEIKRALLGEANGHGSPKELGDRYKAICANREILRTIERIEAAGARAIYRQVDVRDADAVRSLVDEIRDDVGPIKGLVHGAGVLADRRIEEKTAEQFESVYGTKVDSLNTILDSLKDDDLRVLALFSSSTGRFGRIGQIDYAVANEVLNKHAQREARERPRCRVVAVNWGPWDGGMVNAPLKKIFAGEGVGLIPLQAGADYFVSELCQPPGQPVEIVVLGASPGDIPSQNGELASSNLSVAFEHDLTIQSLPILQSHVIKGHAVFPVALMVEWLAHAALHDNPGLVFHGLDDLRVFKGVILSDDRPLRLRLLAAKATREQSLYRVLVEIHGVAPAGQDALHARATVLLAARLPQADGAPLEAIDLPYLRSESEIYGQLLFHGPDLQGIEIVEGCSEAGISATVACAPPPADWIQKPFRSSWLADPLALDCAFQLMILWSHERAGAGSLPSAIGRYRQYSRSFPKDGVRIIARVTKQFAHRAVADIDFIGRDGALVARIGDYECVIDASLAQAFRTNKLPAPSAPSS